MKKIIAIAAIAAATIVSTSASAFWNNGSNNGNGSFPFNGMGDMFGMNEINFSATNNVRANGNGYGHPTANYAGYQAPVYGYAPYGYAAPVAAPVAPVAPAAPVAQ
jgi:hypothetical protein